MKTTETPASECIREVASILATGLLRIKVRSFCAASSATSFESRAAKESSNSSQNPLGFHARESNDPAPLVNARENYFGGQI